MEWPVIDSAARVQPSSGTYRDWKERVAKDCSHRCVYCAIGEGRFGGIRNFHVEHYRPKSKNEELENVIENLFYACSICNVLKGSDWPGDPTSDLSTVSYPNPGEHDFNQLLSVDKQSYLVTGERVSVAYMVERLVLNRPQLIAERRLSATISTSRELLTELSSRCRRLLAQEIGDDEKALLVEAHGMIERLVGLRDSLFRARPYRRADLSR